MPLHDWTRVPAGLFHHFHQDWSIEIARALNRGRLPKGFSALVEQRAAQREPDVLAIESRQGSREPDSGLMIAERPQTRIVRQSDKEIYSRRANRIVVRHHLGRVVAVIELLSPGNTASRAAIRDFVEKAIDLLNAGVHLLVVDLFPPTPRDPFGIHKAIWDEIEEESFDLPSGKDRVFVAYEAGSVRSAFIETVGVGDSLPDMPVFLADDFHVRVPLEATYQATWNAGPDELRNAVERGTIDGESP